MTKKTVPDTYATIQNMNFEDRPLGLEHEEPQNRYEGGEITVENFRGTEERFLLRLLTSKLEGLGNGRGGRIAKLALLFTIASSLTLGEKASDPSGGSDRAALNALVDKQIGHPVIKTETELKVQPGKVVEIPATNEINIIEKPKD